MENNQVNSVNEFENSYRQMMEEGMQDIEDAVNQEVPNNYEELVPDGPTYQDLQLWMKQFPISKIFKIVLIEDTYIIRTMNRVEYKAIAAREDLNGLTREEVISKTCCLFPLLTPEVIGLSDAGVVAALAQFILESSGFTPPEEVQRLA